MDFCENHVIILKTKKCGEIIPAFYFTKTFLSNGNARKKMLLSIIVRSDNNRQNLFKEKREKKKI